MTVEEFMKEIPKLVDQAKLIAKDAFDEPIELSTDISDIEKLDYIVSYSRKLRLKGLIDDHVAWNLSVSLGTVLGEMMIKENGYHWYINKNDIPVVGPDEERCASPITKIEKILNSEEDDEGSPSSFYNSWLALCKYYAMSDEEKEKITETIYIDE